MRVMGDHSERREYEMMIASVDTLEMLTLLCWCECSTAAYFIKNFFSDYYNQNFTKIH